MTNPALKMCRELRGLHPKVDDASPWLPDDAYAADCVNRWLADTDSRCRFPAMCHATVPGDAQTCSGYRCDAKYWRQHNRDVAQVMSIIASFVGGNPNEYRLAGLLHDVDYLQIPHDLGNLTTADAEQLSDIHPTLVARELRDRGAPREMIFAILEHSPHAREPGASMGAMSQSLYFADNFVTCRSAGCALGKEPYSKPSKIPSVLWDKLMELEFSPIQDTKTASSGKVEQRR